MTTRRPGVAWRLRGGLLAALGPALIGAGIALPGCGRADGPGRVATEATEAAGATIGPAARVPGEDGGGSAGSGAEVPFSLPAGFVAERVAGPPLIEHPMFACFDDRGRLYVAGSSGDDLGADERLVAPPDLIRRLEDTDGDGLFDRSVVFADGLTYPQGILWLDGAVFTASPPSLWRLEDTDGDGVADRRLELATGFPFTGIADDLHGPCLGPDGRLYCGVGRFDYAIRRPGGPVIRRGRTPLIVRCRTDGEGLEVFSAAMGNPVEVAFSPEGEAFACGTFLSPESQGEGLRDALVHSVYGGLYSVRDRVLEAETHTGDLLPPLAQLGVAAGSGLMRARGGDLGGDDRVQLYSALFNLREVWRHELERDGSTFRATSEPLLTSEEANFHPTDVLEDADGSLLVLDTGGWFRSCPTSRVDEPDDLGAIYRIRREGASPPADPRGLALDWDGASPEELTPRLDDPRFAVRDRAVQGLARDGVGSVAALEEVLRGDSARARREATWALARIEGDEARAAVRLALADEDPAVRQVAASAAGLHRDAGALPRLAGLAASGEPPVRREAATALGRIGRAEAAPALIDGLRAGADRFLEHALIYALITIDDRDSTLPALRDPSPDVRRGALIALDQMEGGRLTPALVMPCLNPAAPDLRHAAMQVIAGRPEWAGEMVGPLGEWLAQEPMSARRRANVRRVLLAYGGDAGIQGLIASTLRRESTPVGTRVLLLEVMAQVDLDEPPSIWVEAIDAALADPDGRVCSQALAAARAAGVPGLDRALIRLARDPSRAAGLRVEALGILAPRIISLESALFELLMRQLRPTVSPLTRMGAARTLGLARLDPGQLLALTGAVAEAGALALPRLLPAFERSKDRRVGEALVAALARSPGLASLTPEAVGRAVRSFPPEVRRAAEPLRERLDVDAAEKSARLAELQPILDQGDPLRGREVFFGTKATCSTCHTVGTEGGRVGPDLSKIGAARSGRDLLEAVLFPSASFARGFEPFLVATVDGLVHSGIVVRETSRAIVLVDADRNEVSLSRPSIEAIEPDRTSLMPRGLEARLSPQEFTDLLAFLQSLR